MMTTMPALLLLEQEELLHASDKRWWKVVGGVEERKVGLRLMKHTEGSIQSLSHSRLTDSFSVQHHSGSENSYDVALSSMRFFTVMWHSSSSSRGLIHNPRNSTLNRSRCQIRGARADRLAFQEIK